MDQGLLQQLYTNFTKDLQLSNTGTKTSLAFIRNTLASTPLVKENETFQVLSIGGTIFRNALVESTNGSIKVLQSITDKQPSFITKESFLSFVNSQLDTRITKLALNFAYPVEPLFVSGRLDGKLLKGSKENTFSGLVGQFVCEEIERYIQEKQQKTITCSVANDTVCLILSGLTQTTSDHLAAGIVGTGLNFALFLDKNTIVNLESGDYNNFTSTPTGKIIDEASNMKGYGLYEKEVSGAYLYKHFNEVIKQKQIEFSPLTDTAELSYLVSKNTPELSQIANEQLERSAGFVGAQIAAIMTFQNRSLTFIMQGSLFWKADNYKERVKQFAHTLAPQYEATFLNIDDSDILGAAKLIA